MSNVFATHYEWEVKDGCTVGAVVTVHSPRYDLIDTLEMVTKQDERCRDVYKGEGVLIYYRRLV